MHDSMHDRGSRGGRWVGPYQVIFGPDGQLLKCLRDNGRHEYRAPARYAAIGWKLMNFWLALFPLREARVTTPQSRGQISVGDGPSTDCHMRVAPPTRSRGHMEE